MVQSARITYDMCLSHYFFEFLVVVSVLMWLHLIHFLWMAFALGWFHIPVYETHLSVFDWWFIARSLHCLSLSSKLFTTLHRDCEFFFSFFSLSLIDMYCVVVRSKWRHQHTFRLNWWCKINKSALKFPLIHLFFHTVLPSKMNSQQIHLHISRVCGLHFWLWFVIVCHNISNRWPFVVRQKPLMVTLTALRTNSIPISMQSNIHKQTQIDRERERREREIEK